MECIRFFVFYFDVFCSVALPFALCFRQDKGLSFAGTVGTILAEQTADVADLFLGSLCGRNVILPLPGNGINLFL